MTKKYLYICISIVAISILATIMNPSFLSLSNLITILRQACILLMLSLGLTVVIITGNIDLSVGATAALTGCVCAKLMVASFPIPVAILLSCLVGILVGICNGFLVGWLRLPSFVASYGMNMVASGFALMVMQGGIIYDLPKNFHFIGVGYVGIIPLPIIISLALTFMFCFLLRKTTFGRNIYMIGLNHEASIFSAINDRKILVKTFVLSGITASLGGILMTARLNAADAGMSESYGLQIVAAVVVGGTSLLGGEGGVEGTFLGAVILTMIINIMNMNGIDTNWQNFFLGSVIIIIVWTHIWGRKLQEKKRLKKARSEVNT